jgi:hypothetical protein
LSWIDNYSEWTMGVVGVCHVLQNFTLAGTVMPPAVEVMSQLLWGFRGASGLTVHPAVHVDVLHVLHAGQEVIVHHMARH